MFTNTVIGHRYRLGSRLGGGGMADVFEARDLRLARRVAVKSCRANGQDTLDLVAEAELLAALDHPGLLTVYDFGFDGPRPFLVLQLAAGGTLRDRLDTGALTVDRVAEIGGGIADVLSYVHAEGIVHRDVKPANVLFDDDGECYLADFGIAGPSGGDRKVLGTAAYLAPEQVSGGETGPAADVYALGLVLLECLTGEVEFPGDGDAVAMARLAHRPKVPGAWGRAWRMLLTAMTRSDPAHRPGAATCARLLRALCAGTRVPLRELPAPPRTRFAALASTAYSALF